MQTQLIQKKAQIGSQVEFTLTTGNQVSGILKEMSLEHVTLDAAKGEMTILVESIIAVQNLDNINAVETPSNAPNLDNHVDTSDLSNSKRDKTEVLDSADISPSEIEASDSSDTGAGLVDSISEQNGTPDAVDADVESMDSVLEQDGTPDATDTSTESTDSVPEQITASESADANIESTDPVNFEEQASEQLDEIDKRFKNEIECAKIELKPPDFTFPAKELKGWENTGVRVKWLQIKNKYENAQKINELSAKFGRIQPLLMEVKSLVQRFSNSPSLKRVTAYFYAVSDDWQESIQIYQEVVITSEDFNDWFNVAVSALNLNKEELACYSLEKFFNGVSVIDKPDAWYIYVSLVEKFNNLLAFRELCKKDENVVAKGEIEALLDAAIYLFKKKGTTELATEIVKKRIKGEPTESLLKGVNQKLGGQSTGSYRQFLDEFMSARIASEKKTHPITPEYHARVGPAKGKAYHIPSQKRDTQTQEENPYTSAKRADLEEKDLEKAERLYRKCISQNIRHDSAIKDLAMVLVRLDRPGEAVELLEKKRSDIEDKQSLDNTLIMVYPAAGKYEKAIGLLNDSLKQTSEKRKRAHIRLQIASNYIDLGNYASAEQQFRQVLKLHPNNITVQRNLALCLSKQGHYKEAEKVLKQIQRIHSDTKTSALLEAVERAQRTGKFTLDDDSIIEIETALSYFSGELSEFAQFFLERCAFDGVSPGRIKEEKYTGSEKDFRYDIGRLEGFAKRLGTRRPRERSHYYLSVARIYFDLGDNRNLSYRYLCRSFASRADAAVSENKHLDTIQEWYCAALTVYDRDRNPHKDEEQDAVNSIVRYLYSTLGRVHIDLTPKIPSIDKALRDVISNHQDKEKAFDAIAYLVLHSRYAADKILNRLYSDESLRLEALQYLESIEIAIPDTLERFNDFIRPWNELQNEEFNRTRALSNELQLLDNFDLTTAWLEDSIRLVEDIRPRLFFELDQQRVGELQGILRTALELCKQVTFEERERLCIQIDNYCQDRLGEIEESPTKLSVEDVYSIIKVIQQEVKGHLEGLYETSKPQLTLRLAKGKESWRRGDRRIEVQIVVENEEGRMPADALKLVTQADQSLFEGTVPDVELAESLRGGKEAQAILKVPLCLTDAALQSKAFSLPIYAEYGIRGGKRERTPVANLSIQLYSEDEFEKIENPYATYAEGGIVGDTEMFFGREELIQNIAQAIRESRAQSKSVVVFGQKRSGKSSVLYHLKESLQEDRDLLILDLENIAAILGENSNHDEDSETILLNQILKSILTELQYAVEDRVDAGFTPLDIPFPCDQEFYSHPNPQQYFVDIFKSFKRQTFKQEDWHGIRVVLLIDEFQYIYARIVDGKIPESFMQSWKAFLQANYFHTVLVGQDVMPKFKARFPNEFGTTQDERVTYLKPDDARKLIDQPIRIGGRQGDSRYREQAIERILDLTAGSPFYIQIICNRLVEYMNVKHTGLVTEADVEQVKNELIRGVNALGLDKFDNLINSGDKSADRIEDEDALKVLKIIADNSSKTDLCPFDRIGCETSSPVDMILEDIEKRDVVERRDRSYKIQVGLFKEWLIVNG